MRLPQPAQMPAPRRGCLLAALLAAALVLGACSAQKASTDPQEITRDTACSLDGMLLADYPGPKAQIHYEQGKPDFFCDTVEMFATVLRPEQQKGIRAIYVQDMGKADWQSPQGHWIDAKSAYYVIGSKLEGSMGPTIGAFAAEADAKALAQKNGGRVLAFAAITPDMVKLDGGILRDQHM